mmetsp:Transcript_6754/g.12078  ORF Transcript_6754/g.12078 Transcript_6754/m.12078 type:complete len:290 (-) Transcript_6754:1667-2536(-)
MFVPSARLLYRPEGSKSIEGSRVVVVSLNKSPSKVREDSPVTVHFAAALSAGIENNNDHLRDDKEGVRDTEVSPPKTPDSLHSEITIEGETEGEVRKTSGNPNVFLSESFRVPQSGIKLRIADEHSLSPRNYTPRRRNCTYQQNTRRGGSLTESQADALDGCASDLENSSGEYERCPQRNKSNTKNSSVASIEINQFIVHQKSVASRDESSSVCVSASETQNEEDSRIMLLEKRIKSLHSRLGATDYVSNDVKNQLELTLNKLEKIKLRREAVLNKQQKQLKPNQKTSQ